MPSLCQTTNACYRSCSFDLQTCESALELAQEIVPISVAADQRVSVDWERILMVVFMLLEAAFIMYQRRRRDRERRQIQNIDLVSLD